MPWKWFTVTFISILTVLLKDPSERLSDLLSY